MIIIFNFYTVNMFKHFNIIHSYITLVLQLKNDLKVLRSKPDVGALFHKPVKCTSVKANLFNIIYN